MGFTITLLYIGSLRQTVGNIKKLHAYNFKSLQSHTCVRGVFYIIIRTRE